MKRRPVLAAALTTTALAVAPLTLTGGAPAQAAGGPTTTNGCVTSVPDPGTTAPVKICYSLFEPAGASASTRSR